VRASNWFGPVRWLLVKDVAVLRRSPVLVAILVIYPVALALMIGLALSSPPGKPKVAVFNGVKPGHGGVKLGGGDLNINRYTSELFQSITPITATSAAAAIADVRDGRAEAAIIVPADIISQVQSLIRTGSGHPTVRLVLNARNPLERELVDGEIQTRVDELESGISNGLLGTALEDLHIVVAGGQLNFVGENVSLLGLSKTTAIIDHALPLLEQAGFSGTLVPSLRQVRSFAQLAGEGLSFASPVLGQLQAPLTVRRSELSGESTPTSTYAVAIAVAVSELFLALLLAAALLALERSEQVYSRLVRGPVSRGALLAEKVLIGALAAAAVALIMSAVVSIFVGLSWGRFELWVLALGLAGLAFAALGVALGAVAKEVAAASLLAILVGLPVAFLALIPATAVSGGLGHALDVISFVFPFKAGLDAISNALTGASPAIGLALVHLAGLVLGYGLLGRLALARFDD
jgi:ABC-type multidrug transport system permease subunit